jgi:site-specific recombinase XerD
MQLSEATEEFVLAGLGEGWSRGTAERYGWHLKRFCAYLAERQIRTVEALSRHCLREWSASLRDHWAAATRKQAVSAIRSCLRWCEEEGLITSELVGALKTPTVRKQVQRTVTSAEVEALLRECQNLPTAGVDERTGMIVRLRDAAMIVFLFDTFVRASELVGLNLADVNLQDGRAVVLGKGNKRLPVPFGPTTGERLAAWLEVRPATSCPALFVSIAGPNPGQRIKIHSLRQILQRIAERAGVPRLSTHAFRRGGACAASVLGASSVVLKAWGRWENLQQVEDYTRAVGIGGAVERFMPVESIAVASLREMELAVAGRPHAHSEPINPK